MTGKAYPVELFAFLEKKCPNPVSQFFVFRLPFTASNQEPYRTSHSSSIPARRLTNATKYDLKIKLLSDVIENLHPIGEVVYFRPTCSKSIISDLMPCVSCDVIYQRGVAGFENCDFRCIR